MAREKMPQVNQQIQGETEHWTPEVDAALALDRVSDDPDASDVHTLVAENVEWFDGRGEE